MRVLGLGYLGLDTAESGLSNLNMRRSLWTPCPPNVSRRTCRCNAAERLASLDALLPLCEGTLPSGLSALHFIVCFDSPCILLTWATCSPASTRSSAAPRPQTLACKKRLAP